MAGEEGSAPGGGLGGSEADTQSPPPLDGRGRDDEECDGRSERPSEDLSLLHGRVAGATKGQAGRDPLFTRGGFVKKEEKEGRRRRRNAYGGHAWRGRGCAGVGRRRLAVEGTGTPGRERRLGQAVGGDRGRWAAGVARVETKKKKKEKRDDG